MLDLAEFWRARRPEVRFVTRLPDDDVDLPEFVQENRFRRMKTLQKFASVHALVHNFFNQERHFTSRQTYKESGGQ